MVTTSGPGSIRFVIDESDLTTASTTARYTTGSKKTADAGEEWVYVYANLHPLNQYIPYVVAHTGTYVSLNTITTGGGVIAVPQYTIASGSYGWVQYKGNLTVAVGAGTCSIGSMMACAMLVGGTANLLTCGATNGANRDTYSVGVSKSLLTTGATSTQIPAFLFGDSVAI